MRTLIFYPERQQIRNLFDRIQLPLDSPYFKFTYLVDKPFAFNLKGTVVDFESTGLPSTPHAKVITAGFFSGRLIKIYQAFLFQRLAEFHNVVKNQMLYRPLPFFAYSTELERQFSHFGNRFSKAWCNLLEWDWDQGWSGEPYQYRKKLTYCIDSPRDDIDGASVPRQWFKWVNYSNINALFEILYHNLLDLLRESYVARKVHRDSYEIYNTEKIKI